MKKTNKNLMLLAMLFGISLVISNVVTGKLIYTGISLFGTVITLPGAAVCYAITFLITDIIGEVWGKKAYIASQTWDVFFFHKIRDKYIAKHGTRNGGRWLWNNCSTLTSQIIDTVLFIGISFGIGFGWFFQKEMHPTLAAMMVGQYLFKALLALLDTPFFYFFTRKASKEDAAE